MSLSINQDKIIKPATFFGALIMFAAIVVLGFAYIIPSYHQWTPNEFLIEFAIGSIMFISSFIPSLRIK